MNFLQTLQDSIVRFVTIDKNLEELEDAIKALRQNNIALRDKVLESELRIKALENAATASDENAGALKDELKGLSDRVLVLESTLATANDLQSLRERVAVLEKSRDNERERVEIELTRFQLQVERFGVQMSQLPLHQPPQLPPTNPTDN